MTCPLTLASPLVLLATPSQSMVNNLAMSLTLSGYLHMSDYLIFQVNIRNIELVNNPAKFDDGYHFRIKFEAIAPLAEGQCSSLV